MAYYTKERVQEIAEAERAEHALLSKECNDDEYVRLFRYELIRVYNFAWKQAILDHKDEFIVALMYKDKVPHSPLYKRVLAEMDTEIHKNGHVAVRLCQTGMFVARIVPLIR
jgi:hypothetical protein